MGVSSIRGLCRYLTQYSGFSGKTINSVIYSLGYHPQNATKNDFLDLSAELENCACHGANIGIPGFIYYSETSKFFRKHRYDIVSHMEQTAAEFGADIISMVQNFGIFRNSEKPATSEVGKALWGKFCNEEFTTFYNVFAWYALEEISNTWYRYLEENPACHAELSA